MHTVRVFRSAEHLSRLVTTAGRAWLLASALGLALAPIASVLAADETGVAPPQQTAPAAETPGTPIYVATATGVVDNVLAGYIDEAVKRAAADGAPALVIQLNT